MAQFTVRNIEEDLKVSLKQRAARHGCSLEEEVRRILRTAVRPMRPKSHCQACQEVSTTPSPRVRSIPVPA